MALYLYFPLYDAQVKDNDDDEDDVDDSDHHLYLHIHLNKTNIFKTIHTRLSY